MSISIEEVDRIAKLARLQFSDSEKQKLQQELSSILDYIDQLKDVEDKSGRAGEEDLDGVNLMREDDILPAENPEEFLVQAPAKQDKFIKVKSILE